MLEKWLHDYWLLLPFQNETTKLKPEWGKVNSKRKRLRSPQRYEKFYNGNFKEIKRRLGIKYSDERSDERYAEQLLECSLELGQRIDFEVRTAPSKKQIFLRVKKHASMKGISSQKEDERKKELIGLVSRLEDLPSQRLNRPLYYYISALAIYWEKWTGREIKRANEKNKNDVNLKFYDFADYCVQSMGLSKIWGTGSVKKAIQKVISNFLLPMRVYLKKAYPSISLGDINLSDIMESIYLLDSVSESISNLIIDNNLLKL